MGDEIKVLNPFTGQAVGTVKKSGSQDVSNAITKIENGFKKWRHSKAFERKQLLKEIYHRLLDRREEFAKLICEEAGKPITLANAEVGRALDVLEWAAGETVRFAGELLRTDVTSSGRPGWGICQFFPRGPVLGITPFNFPLNLLIHKAAPALASGCSILIKPSPETPLVAEKIVQLIQEIEPEVIEVIHPSHEETARLTQHPLWGMVSFTGSAKVGWTIKKQAPLKPIALELGGNAWLGLMEDVPEEDLSKICQKIAAAAFGYAGQSCISVQNILVHQGLWSGFSEEMGRAIERVTTGDPSQSEILCGPVINEAARIRLRSLQTQLKDGSEFIGAKSQATAPNLIEPGIFFFPKREYLQAAETTQKEVFGPFAFAAPFENDEELVFAVNSSPYGLQSGVYTNDLRRVQRLFEKLQVGGLIVNEVPTTRYDHQPYGGIKESGMGREGVRYAMEEFSERKFLSLGTDRDLHRVPLGRQNGE